MRITPVLQQERYGMQYLQYAFLVVMGGLSLALFLTSPVI